MKELTFLALLSLMFCLSACDKDEDDMSNDNDNDPGMTITCDGSMPTYDGAIKGIINSSCTASSCHGANSANGVFTTFAGMADIISTGSFKSRVLVSRSMPQGATLSDAQLTTIQCWADNGYPEN